MTNGGRLNMAVVKGALKKSTSNATELAAFWVEGSYHRM
jgi:hypothetical protein